MKAEDGTVIGKKCDGCHTMLATEEENPEIIEILPP